MMSLNQNLNKFSKIKQGKLAKKRLARLSFYSDSRAALMPYITCIFRIYFTFQLRFFFLFCFYLLAENLFLAHVYLAFCIWQRLPCPRLHHKTWTRTGQEALQSYQIRCLSQKL